jgi:hypothetical protein
VDKKELIKAGKDALLRDGLDGWGAMGARQMAERVVEAIEPLIRADEAERVLGSDYSWVVDLAMTDLLGKVAGLPTRGIELATGEAHEMVWRREVMNLIEGKGLT